MRTLTSIFCSAAIAIAIANFIQSAQAQAPGLRQQNFGTGDRFFPALSSVLTDGQRQSYLTAVESQSEKIRPLEEKMRASRRALLDAVAGGQFDEAAARQNAEESAKAEAELTVIFAKALSEMQPPLSARQVGQMQSFQPGQFQRQNAPSPQAAPGKHLDLPPPLPRDSNDLPVVTPQK